MSAYRLDSLPTWLLSRTSGRAHRLLADAFAAAGARGYHYRALAALEPVVIAVGKRALGASLDDLGSATFRADLASMRHETQYTRLFRS